MTVLVRLGAVESRRFGFELVKPLSVVVSGGSASATVSALGSVEFTTCETLSLNGVFSSGYDNYIVSIRHVHSANTGILITGKLRSSGTDTSGSDYTRQYIDASSTSIGAARETSQTTFRFAPSSNNQRSGASVYFYGPALAQPTAIRGVTVYGQSGALINDAANTHSLSTAYDGFTIAVSPGTLSGRVAVYGMRG